MADNNTKISLPTSPEEIGVSLPPANLRRIDFSALDFESQRRTILEYVKTYYPDDFNDFVLSNGFIMLSEVVAASSNILSERSDILADESFLPTARSKSSVSQHLELIGQRLKRATSATVNIECSISVPTSFDIAIPAGLIFTIIGPDGSPLNYELFSAPGDYNSDLIIPKSKRGIIGYGIEGKFGSPVIEISNGGPDQFIDISADNVLDSPIIVEVASGENSVRWNRVQYIEQAGANDKAFQVIHLDDRTRIQFGDDITGKSPISGQEITIRYRLGGGTRGRISSGTISESKPISQDNFATQTVIFRNPSPSRGGTDNESIDSAKRRAPKLYAVHNNLATADDYIAFCESFSHPAFGSVQKASAVIRSGIDKDLDVITQNVMNAKSIEEGKKYLLGNYVNRNIIEIYILQENNQAPAKPNAGLKESLKTAISNINVFTDEARILDGLIRLIDIEATIVVSRDIDASIVKENVSFAINNVFNISNIRMGQGFYKSDLIKAITEVDGVKNVRLFKPVDDYPSLKSVVDKTVDQKDRPHAIGVNELFVLGAQNLQFYIESGNLNV